MLVIDRIVLQPINELGEIRNLDDDQSVRVEDLPGSAQKIDRVIKKLYPEITALDFKNPYELLVATILSAQCTDKKVNEVTKSLFSKYPEPRSLAEVDIEEHPDAESLRELMLARDHEPKARATRGQLIESLLINYLEPNLIQPTFVYDYPRDISPLAKSKTDDPNTVERFEGFVAGFEICNAFTELNDPLDQEQRFLEMGREYEADDEERHPMDEDYLRAMRYGMPPCGGFGMGVDRLVMLLTDQPNIREVLLYPHLRSRD